MFLSFSFCSCEATSPVGGATLGVWLADSTPPSMIFVRAEAIAQATLQARRIASYWIWNVLGSAIKFQRNIQFQTISCHSAICRFYRCKSKSLQIVRSFRTFLMGFAAICVSSPQTSLFWCVFSFICNDIRWLFFFFWCQVTLQLSEPGTVWCEMLRELPYEVYG